MLSIAIACKAGKICPKLVTNAPEDGQSLLVGAFECGRIFEAAMYPVRRAKQDRAAFSGVIADRDHIIELAVLELVDVLRPISAYVNS